MLAIARSYSSIELRTPETAQELATLVAPIPANLSQFSFSPNSQQLAIGRVGYSRFSLRDLRSFLKERLPDY
ncbi:MAG: hypothetical protein ABI651_20540, partial [Verrucomicrobiota bacterium]